MVDTACFQPTQHLFLIDKAFFHGRHSSFSGPHSICSWTTLHLFMADTTPLPGPHKRLFVADTTSLEFHPKLMRFSENSEKLPIHKVTKVHADLMSGTRLADRKVLGSQGRATGWFGGQATSWFPRKNDCPVAL